MSEPKKIISWNLGIEWDDGTEETIVDVPNWVAISVDAFLREMEEEYE